MYCSLHEAWPDFTKLSPGINTISTVDHHMNNNNNIHNQFEHFNQNQIQPNQIQPNQIQPNQIQPNQIQPNQNFKTHLEENRPELVNNSHYNDKYGIQHQHIENYMENINKKNKRENSNTTNELKNIYHNQIQKKRLNGIGCEDFIEHLEECEECRMYISNRYGKSNKLAEILSTNPQLRETLMVFLIGILILMILNLFYK
jgi:hypothetical protein